MMSSRAAGRRKTGIDMNRVAGRLPPSQPHDGAKIEENTRWKAARLTRQAPVPRP